MALTYMDGTLDERNGDMEYTERCIMEYDPDVMDENAACLAVACFWRSADDDTEAWDNWDDSVDGFWSDHSLIFPFNAKREINKRELGVAQKYLNIIAISAVHKPPPNFYKDEDK